MVPKISDTAFWDVKKENIDFEKHSLYVMEKIFNYGKWNDQLEIMRYYGLERIKKEIVRAGWLKKQTISFLCTILHLQPDNFECYIKKQSAPFSWNY